MRASITRTATALLILSGTLVSGRSHAETASREAEAQAAARAWLALVDGGKYADSWSTAASLFRNAVTKEQWTQQVAAVRDPLGAVLERKVKSSRYSTSLPGAPDGEYVVLQFSTRYANKKAALETVTPMRDKDGAWRVSGYFIR